MDMEQRITDLTHNVESLAERITKIEIKLQRGLSYGS